MNGNEKMYEAVSGIRDDLIESAGEYKFERKRRSFARIGYAAAACLVVGASLFGLSRLAKKPVNTHEAAIPTEQTAAAPTDNSADPEKKVLYNENENNGFADQFVPGPGKTNISYPLCERITDAEYADCLFAVKLEPTNVYEDIWRELGNELRDREKDPDYIRYIGLYEEWELTTFLGMTAEELAAYYGCTYSEFDDRPNHPTNGFKLMNEDFQKHLKTELDPAEYDRCIEAFERWLAIDDEMWGSRTRINARMDEGLRSESERFLSLGLDVELTENCIIGYLSGEQIVT